MNAVKALEALEIYGTPDCKVWRSRIFSRHPWFAGALAREYQRRADETHYIDANAWLKQFEVRLKLGRTGLFVDCQDSEIVDYSKSKAAKIHGLIAHYAATFGRDLYRMTIERIRAEVNKTGVGFPLDSAEYDRDQAIAALARCCEPTWWRRKLRVMAARQLEQICRDLGMVSKRAAPYVSDYTLNRRAEQKTRNRQLLLGLEAENEETGYKANLAEISDATVSNPINRRNELMVRMRGYEECARAAGFDGVFLTLTCPSKYHATLHTGKRNPKYTNSTPDEAQKYLCDLWAKIRAKWGRRGIRTFGFRIAEPHHDGTPHWHLLLFFAPDRTNEAAEIFREYALKMDEHERGAKQYRCEVVRIDPARGSATGYIAKYVSKNIDGYGMGGDFDYETGGDVIENARRVEAWASTWGIRQFQQIGSASVTVWRELRRLREPLESASLEELEQIRCACDAGDWARFVELMGGPMVERDGVKVRPLHLHSVEKDRAENQYGEICTRLMGIIMRGAVHAITRIHTWKIKRAEVDDVADQYEQWAFRAPPRRDLDLCQ